MRVTDGKVIFRIACEGGPEFYLVLVKMQSKFLRLPPFDPQLLIWFISLVAPARHFAVQARRGLRSGHYSTNSLPLSGELADGRYNPVPDLVTAAVPISHKPGLLVCPSLV